MPTNLGSRGLSDPKEYTPKRKMQSGSGKYGETGDWTHGKNIAPKGSSFAVGEKKIRHFGGTYSGHGWGKEHFTKESSHKLNLKSKALKAKMK